MSKIFDFIRRTFRRTPPPARKVDYVRQGDLPDDPDELVRLGVITPWRVEAVSNEAWYTAEPGAVDWFAEKLGGQADES
ncbi:MAG: hypothetical protein GXX96_31175 [Planctomycetaceae bacterium]|nr:hypothetical protein [Planctomycetaceae bacterium]